MNIQKKQLYDVNIESYSSEGFGICRVDGFVVFVRDAAVGDKCQIRVIKVLKNFAYARIEQLYTPSSARVSSECTVFPMCGGCDFWHISYEEELRLKKERVEDALQRIGGFDLKAEEIIGSVKLLSYRNKAQYPVQMLDGMPITGFYRKNSHTVVPVNSCLIQSETASVLTQVVKDWMLQYKIPAYDEAKKAGIVRHVYVRTSSNGDTLLCIVAYSENLPFADKLIEVSKAACPSLRGVVLNINKTQGNAILGKKEKILYGDGYIEDSICGLVFRISPLSFFQINHDQAEKLYSRAISYADLSSTDTALDLYCGTGTITLLLARKCANAIGVEIVPEAIKDAKKNGEVNGIHNVRFLCLDAGKAAELLLSEKTALDTITVDPPRKGMDEKTVSAILSLQPKKIVYISCDPATMARDCKILSSGGYSPVRLSVFDMFPRTANVESIVLLQQN